MTERERESKMRFEELKGYDPSSNAITGLNSSGISPSVSIPNNNASFLQPPASHNGFLSQMRAHCKINEISYIYLDKPTSPRHPSHRLLTTQTGKQPAGIRELQLGTEHGTGAFIFFLPCVFGILNTFVSHVVIAIRSLSQYLSMPFRLS